MRTALFWKKGIFASTFKIYSENNLVGKLTENSWTHSADGELNGKKYSFKTTWLFKLETQIIDCEKNIPIGTITHDSFMSQAIIKYSDKVVNWIFNNAWNSKWSAYDANGVQISFQGSSSNGKIEFDVPDDLLILTGLYISNYYWQNTVATVITVLLPIFFIVLI